jgi:VCBS repeat-containing protein
VAVNDAPVAVDDSYIVAPAGLTVAAPGVLGNDSDAEGDALTAVLVSGPTMANSFTLNADGSFNYTSSASSGSDTFTYKAKDSNNAESNVATVTLNLNQAPTAVDDAYSTNEDTNLTVVAPGVAGNDTDPDGTVTGAVLVTGPTNAASFTLNADGSFSYTPSANFNGSDSFTYNAQDNGGMLSANAATVTITVLAANDAPTLDNNKVPALIAEDEDSPAPVGAVGTPVSSLVDFASPSGQVDNVTDIDAGALLGIAVTAADTTNGSWFYSSDNGGTWTALGSPTETTARLLGAASGRLYFQPSANFNGTIASAITFRAWDQTTGSSGATANTSANGGTTAFSTATDTASLTINPVNDNPTAQNESFTGAVGNTAFGVGTTPAQPSTSTAGDVLSNDADIDGPGPLTAGPANITSANGGTVTMNSDGTFTYVSGPGFTGNDTFT